ncbi:MAG: ATP-dependent 6-phosphofructokinase [Rhodospirillaceae bacterium]
MALKRRIGVLTSGGDCPGLNAVIRGVTQHATENYDCEVVGIHDGHHGLLASPPQTETLSPALFSGELLRAGGTILGSTTSGDPFAYPMPDGSTCDRSTEIVDAIAALKLDGLVVIGGDGSMRIFNRLLTSAGVPWVGVPKTIDNDVPGTDFAVGFFTAVDVVGGALDRLQSTAASHRRIMVLETMGRESGFLALFGGVAGGADAILIPEMKYDIAELAEHVCRIRSEQRAHVLIAIAEGVPNPRGEIVTLPYFGSNQAFGGVGTVLADELGKLIDVSTRCTVLGHLQRGGSPSMFDRLLGSALSVRAVDALMNATSPRLAAWRAGQVTDIPMSETITGPRKVDAGSEMLSVAKGLGVYMGSPRLGKMA